jgi:hypothetical protein
MGVVMVLGVTNGTNIVAVKARARDSPINRSKYDKTIGLLFYNILLTMISVTRNCVLDFREKI